MASSIKFLAHPWELIASLWSSPANIPTPVTLTAAAVPVPIPDQALIPQGLCGWVPSEPGAPANFVCQAMGQSMPGVVFFVSMSVLVMTILFLVRYIRRSAVVAGELESLAKSLTQMKAAPGEWAKKDSWEKIRGNLNASGKQAPPLSEFAKQIQAEIVPLPSDPSSRVAPKTAISELAAGIIRNERWSGQSLAEALPGWLTAIGLLTTFLAILLGLQGVKVLTNLEVRGIGGLVNGLSGKFFSSIISLGCAITITIVHYFVSGSLRLRWNTLVDRLQELVPHLSVERIFLEMVASRKNEQ